MADLRKFLILGDSILKGVVLDENHHYHLSKSLDWEKIGEIFNAQILNYAKMGQTIVGASAKLETIFTQEVDIQKVIIEFGGNDSDYVWKEVAENRSLTHLPNTPPSLFKNKLIELIRLVQEHQATPILMTLPPVNSQKYFKWVTQTGYNQENIIYFLRDIEVIYRRQELYSNIIKDVAYTYNIELVDVREAFLATDDFQKMLCDDGIHLNASGQELVLDTFAQHFHKEYQHQ